MKPLDPWTMPLCATSLIEASAGTGKTYTLTTLYLRLLAEAGMHPSQILVVTYTQAATAELRERVRERLREAIDAADRAEELGVDSLEEAEPLLEEAKAIMIEECIFIHVVTLDGIVAHSDQFTGIDKIPGQPLTFDIKKVRWANQ